jgi:hypothetical protein
VPGTIGLAYVVTRWLFIDRFPHESANSAEGLALPAFLAKVAA